MKINLVPLEVKDEILDGEAKYNIYDENGKLLHENCSISLSTNILQIGTALNKVFFDKIEANLEAVANKDNGESFKRYIFAGIYNELKTPFLLDSTFEIKELAEEELINNISGIQSDISSIESDITSLKTRVTKLEG